jgi:hypothetical protein
MHFAGGYGFVNTVDIFNARSGVWTTAALSVARYIVAATSLPNDGLAIFAGGQGASFVLLSVIAGGGVWGGGGFVGRVTCAAAAAADC